MASENQFSALESVQNDELTTRNENTLDGGSTDHDHGSNSSKVNGSPSSVVVIHDDVGTDHNADTNGLPHDNHAEESAEIAQVGNSSPVTPKTKGFGLKKWRRIRRDFVRDASPVDSGKVVLKRGPPVSGNPANKSTNSMPHEFNQDSQSSIGSVNVSRNLSVADKSVSHGSGFDSKFAVGHVFATGADSENSDDRSSKSSTAASVPRMRYDLPAVAGSTRDKNKVKSLSGKSAVASPQKGQRGKGAVESSKKPRGERVKIDKENSHSSMESDSRSANFVFLQAASSATSNEKVSGRSMNYGGEKSNDPHAHEHHFTEEVQTGYGQENVREVDDLSQDEVAAEASWEKEDKNENHQYSSDQDPLVESVLTLQSVQRALESEVQKLGEVGKFNNVPADSSLFGSKINELRSSEQFHSENITQSSSLESQVLVLTENVKGLEYSLREVNAMLKVKESRAADLEAALSTTPAEGSANAPEFLQCQLKGIETEFEDLLRERIEAEILYLALTRTVEELRVVAGDQLNLFEQQEALAGEQVQMLGKLAKAQSKAARLDEQAVELVKYSEDILETEEVLNMQGRVCKATTCFFIQLILLVWIFWLLVLQLSSRHRVVVPT